MLIYRIRLRRDAAVITIMSISAPTFPSKKNSTAFYVLCVDFYLSPDEIKLLE